MQCLKPQKPKTTVKKYDLHSFTAQIKQVLGHISALQLALFTNPNFCWGFFHKENERQS